MLCALDSNDVPPSLRSSCSGGKPGVEGQVGPSIARRVRADYALRIDMTKPKPKDQLQKRGRKSDFRPEYILIAKACARFGAIDEEIAAFLDVSIGCIKRWKLAHPEFRAALKSGKEASDNRVEDSLYRLAVGWNGQAPNVTAAVFWLKNRRPNEWRDVQNIDHAVGVYHISKSPLTEEQWIESTRSDATDVLPSSTYKKPSH